MSLELNQRLTETAERGEWRGADAVIAAARAELDSSLGRLASETAARPGWVFAFGAAVVVMLAIGGAALLFTGGGQVADDVTTTFATTTTQAVTTTAAPTTTESSATPASSTATDTTSGQAPFVLASSWTPEFTGAVADLAFSDGWLWAADDLAGIVRIDASTGEVETAIDLDMPTRANIELGEGAVWVTHGSWLTQIDPESAQVVNTVGIGSHSTSRETRPLAVGSGAVWLATETGVGRFDPSDISLTREIEIGATPSGIVLGSEALWVLVGQEILRIDPVSLEIVARVPVPGSIFYPSFGTPLAYGNGAVWIGAGGLARLDPATNDITTVIRHGDGCCGPTAIGFAAGNVIISDEPTVLAAVDAATGTLERIGVTECAVFFIAGSDDGFWAAASRCGPVIQRYDFDRR